MWILHFSAAFFTRLTKLTVGLMRLTRLASFDSFNPVGERLEVHVEGAKNGGMTSQTHFDRACPLLKLGQKVRFQALAPLIHVGHEALFHGCQALFHGYKALFHGYKALFHGL
jgi:hypothetical protein